MYFDICPGSPDQSGQHWVPRKPGQPEARLLPRSSKHPQKNFPEHIHRGRGQRTCRPGEPGERPIWWSRLGSFNFLSDEGQGFAINDQLKKNNNKGLTFFLSYTHKRYNLEKKLFISRKLYFSFFFIIQTAVSARKVREMDIWANSNLMDFSKAGDGEIFFKMWKKSSLNIIQKFWFWHLRFQQFSASPDTLTIQQKWKSEKVDFMH